MEVAGYAHSALTGLFDVEVFSCQVGMVKPEPEIYLHALRKLSLDAPDCVFVGDGGSNELEGARAVGLQTIFVSVGVEDLWPDRLEERASVAHHRIRRPPEMLELPLLCATASGIVSACRQLRSPKSGRSEAAASNLSVAATRIVA